MTSYDDINGQEPQHRICHNDIARTHITPQNHQSIAQPKPINPSLSSKTRLLCRTFRILSNILRSTCQVLRILLRYLFCTFPFNASLIKKYPAYLRDTHAHEEEVHSSQAVIVSVTAAEVFNWARRTHTAGSEA